MKKGFNVICSILNKVILLCTVFLFKSVGSYSQESDTLALTYPHINYTTKDGLPSNETFCVFQDSRGYIWIGTDRGLVKYDGYEFKTYTTLDGLTDNVVLAINEDDKGNIWYSCLNNVQLGYIDPNMKFHVYKFYDQLLKTAIRVNGFGNIHFDQIFIDGNDKYLVNNRYGYIIVNDEGIESYDIRSHSNIDTQKKYTDTKIYNEGFNFIYSYRIGWNLNNHRVNVYNNNKKIYSYLKQSSFEIYPTIVTDKDSIEYIYDGRDYLKKKGRDIEHFNLTFQCSAFKLNENEYIYSLYGNSSEGSDDIIYVSNSPDVFSEKKVIFKGGRIVSAIKDSNGGIWLATLKNGILYLPDLSSQSLYLRNPLESILPLKKGIILETKTKRFLYQNDSLLVRYNAKEIGISDISQEFKKISFFKKVILNTKLKNIKAVPEFAGINGVQYISDSMIYALSSSYIYTIIQGKTYYDRLYVNDGIFPYCESMYCFKEDSCLYGARNGFYDYNGFSMSYLDKERNKRIRHIDYFKESDILVYSVWGEGITLEYKDGEQMQLSDKNGLVSNTINAIFMDENEVLWLGTNKGINRLSIDSKSGNYKLETVSNGSKNLSSPNILQIYYQDSTLYLGTDVGFDIIDLTLNQKGIEKDIPIVLDSVQINNRLYELNRKTFQLDHEKNNLTFYYTAIAFNMFGQINYRYKMEGLSDQWIYSKERKAIFMNMNPGRYKFILQVKNEYGNWIELERDIQFTINKPYWETWWFRVIIFGILGYVVYYYISNLRKEKAFVESEKIFVEQEKRLLEELNESQQKALSSQLNPHFVFNSLNSIQNFILTKRTELSSDYLSMFSKLMRFVFENSKKLYVPLFDEIEALRLYLELEQVRHNHKFRYQIDYESINTQEFVIPALLIQPIIENAIWHGLLHKLEDDRLLEIRFHSNDTHLQIEVKDNGVGRGVTASKSRPKFIKKQRSSGVELTKQRLDLLSQSTGLETNFEIIDLFDGQNNPNGTLVKVIIPRNLEP